MIHIENILTAYELTPSKNGLTRKITRKEAQILSGKGILKSILIRNSINKAFEEGKLSTNDTYYLVSVYSLSKPFEIQYFCFSEDQM